MSVNATESLRKQIRNKMEAKDYLRWLARSGLSYHLDDDPKEIVWVKPLTEAQVEDLCKNSDDLWSVCNPWEVFNEDDQLWDEFLGQFIDDRHNRTQSGKENKGKGLATGC